MEINPQIRPTSGLSCRTNYMEKPINGSRPLGIVIKISRLMHMEKAGRVLAPLRCDGSLGGGG
jgi:hypothetical protein